MSKGEETRKQIVGEALVQSTRLGLDGVSLGPLASALGLSKSGLYAHFKSKEALQQAVLEEALARFLAVVVWPALALPPGEDRLRRLFVGYLDWIKGRHPTGGCPFLVFIQNLHDQPGPLRDRLVRAQKDWRRLLAETVTAATSGSNRTPIDGEQAAFELVGIAHAYQVYERLLGDRSARRRAMAAFERLMSQE